MYSVAKWSVADYHKMIEAGILSDRGVELMAEEIVQTLYTWYLNYNPYPEDIYWLIINV